MHECRRLSGYLHFSITMRRYAQRACEKIVKFHGNWCNQRIDEKRIVFIQIPWNGNWNENGRYLEAFFCHLLTPFTFKKILLNRRRNHRKWSRKKKNYRYVWITFKTSFPQVMSYILFIKIVFRRRHRVIQYMWKEFSHVISEPKDTKAKLLIGSLILRRP